MGDEDAKVTIIPGGKRSEHDRMKSIREGLLDWMELVLDLSSPTEKSAAGLSHLAHAFHWMK